MDLYNLTRNNIATIIVRDVSVSAQTIITNLIQIEWIPLDRITHSFYWNKIDNDVSTNGNIKLANYYSGNIICCQILLLAVEFSETLANSWLVSSSFQTGKKKYQSF